MRDPLELEECIICLHSLDIDPIGSFLRILEIEIVSSLIIIDLSRIPPCIIHCMGDMDSFFFPELEVDLTELWCLMSDTCTVGVSDEVRMVDFVILVSIFPVIVLWKWWNISESDELRSLEFSHDRIFSFSLEYSFESILCDDKLLSELLCKGAVTE